MKKRRPLLLVALFGLLSCAALVSYMEMASAADAVGRSRDELAACRRLARAILALQDMPGIAALEAAAPATITDRIEEARRKARLPDTSLIRIQPESSARIGQSPYRVAATRLELRLVSLQQIIEFARLLCDENNGITVRDLRLWTSGSGPVAAARELWSAELALTQLVYSPTRK